MTVRSRRNRLPAGEDFLVAMRLGRRLLGHAVRLHYRPMEAPMARLGIVVSRRVGSAVVRNRIKRIVREVFRQLHTTLGAADWVVVIQPTAERVPAPILRDELTRLFQSVKRTLP